MEDCRFPEQILKDLLSGRRRIWTSI